MGGFSLLHQELLANVECFFAAFSSAVASLPPDPFASGKGEGHRDYLVGLGKVQMYSRAVQVFAAMTAESALSAYGLIRFGEETFESSFAMLGPVRRLKEMAEKGAGTLLPENHPLVQLLLSLAHKRNRLVHPRAEESSFNEELVVVPASTVHSHAYQAEAVAAHQEIHEFLRRFADLDTETRSFILPGTYV